MKELVVVVNDDDNDELDKGDDDDKGEMVEVRGREAKLCTQGRPMPD